MLWLDLFSWMPPALAIVFFIFLAALVIYIVLRIVAIILNAIPFL